MKVIKETTLHPEGNDGVDLYPKTNINQVENLNEEINSLENSILLNTNNKLDKPATPTADSAVTMLADGTVGTKLLSEIGGSGGGKLYRHEISVKVDEKSDLYFYFIDNVQNYSTFKDIPIKEGVGCYGSNKYATCPAVFYISVSDNILSIYFATMNISNPSAGVQYNDVHKDFGLIPYTDTAIEL